MHMNNEPTTSEIVKSINNLATKVDDQAKQTDERFKDVLKTVDTLATKVDTLATKVDTLATKVDDQAKQTDDRFNDMNKKFDEVLEAINTLSTHTDERFEQLEGDVNHMRMEMVTKNYLDDKLSDLRGDLVVLLRKEDRKVAALVEVLLTRKVISNEDAKTILAMELFPQIVL